MKLVYVEWTDASSGMGWRAKEVFAEEGLLHCRSIGWVMHEDKERLVIAATTHDPRHCEGFIIAGTCDITIPRGMIKKTKVLKRMG